MKRNPAFFFLVLLVGLGVYTSLTLPTMLPKQPDLITKDGPGHPGWVAQWETMKLGKDKQQARAYLRAVQDNVSAFSARQSFRRSDNPLIDIEEIGPFNVGGRVRAFTVNWANPNQLFAAGVSGGMWQSADRGQSWTPVNDDASNLSITFLTQSPFDPAVIYYCTGESSGNSAGIPGDGLYKSIDTGKTFTKLQASDTVVFDYSWRIVHSLVDSHTIFIGTRSHGLWRSTDGGQQFEQVRFFGNRAINDIEVFRDSSIIITIDNLGLFKSPNGEPGSFTKLTTGLPASNFGRVELAYCDSFPAYIYAAFENNGGDGLEGFYRSTDTGATWQAIGNPDDEYGFNFPWYCLTLAVHPSDSNFVIAGSVGLGYTQNGGATWREVAYSHADNHIVQFNPANVGEFYVGNDGGMYRYDVRNMELQVTDLNNGLNITQFYTGAFFPESIRMYGGTQDNGTQATKNARPAFDHIFGGDGSFTQVNQQLPDITYISWQRGNIYRADDSYLDFPSYYRIGNEMDADGDNSIDDGAWFINPFDISPNDGEHIFFVTRLRLWKSEFGGNYWEPATNIISTLQDNPYCVGVSDDENPTVYIGGEGAMLFRQDSVFTAQPGDEVNLSGTVPDSVTNDFIVNITVHPYYDSVIYVAFSNFAPRPRLYKVTAANTANPVWHNISATLPEGLPVNWVQVSSANDSLLVAATDYGLYVTTDEGQSWVREMAIPAASIHMIRLRQTDGKLFIFTHGRGIWTAQLPDYFPLQVEEPARSPQPLELFPNPAHTQFTIAGITATASYQIMAVSGQIVHAGTTNGIVPVADLPAGQYWIRVKTDADKPERVGSFVKH